MAKKITKYFILLSLLLLATASHNAFAKAPCTDLPVNLSLGMTGSKTGGQVILLQKYLQEKGYLDSSLPTGRFGNATVSAVKKLQKNNGISTTGTAGPQTRAVIKKFSCSATDTASIAPAPSDSSSNLSALSSLLDQIAAAQSALATASGQPTTSDISTTPPTTTVVDSSTNTVIAPQAGNTLTVGQTYNISWSGNSHSSYDILLENNEKVGAGYIAKNMSGNHYDWQIGSIFISGMTSTTLPGEYRIHLRSKDSRTQDQTSGIFMIQDKPVIIDNITPSTVQADDTSTVIIYGSGFEDTATIVSNISPIVIYPASISRDGKVILFTVPENFRAGVHTIKVVNHYDINATSTPYNSVNLNITHP